MSSFGVFIYIYKYLYIYIIHSPYYILSMVWSSEVALLRSAAPTTVLGIALWSECIISHAIFVMISIDHDHAKKCDHYVIEHNTNICYDIVHSITNVYCYIDYIFYFRAIDMSLWRHHQAAILPGRIPPPKKQDLTIW